MAYMVIWTNDFQTMSSGKCLSFVRQTETRTSTIEQSKIFIHLVKDFYPCISDFYQFELLPTCIVLLKVELFREQNNLEIVIDIVAVAIVLLFLLATRSIKN